MAVWVKTNMETDNGTKTSVRGVKPFPFGNYSLGCAPFIGAPKGQ